MKLFNKLPGFERSPPGVEWARLRRLPLACFRALHDVSYAQDRRFN